MKLLVTLALLASTAAFANQNLNQKVDAFLSDITKIRMETFKIYDGTATAEQVKETVCLKLVDLHFVALDLQQELLSQRHPTQRELNVAENIYKNTARTVMFCGDQTGLGENEKIYNLAGVLQILENAGSLALSLKTEPLPDEGQVNCDNLKDSLRLAIDPVSERLWIVRLNENGKPEDRLPQELRTREAYVVSVSHYRCKGCYDFSFKLSKDAPYSITAKVFNYNLNIFDMSNPDSPEKTWDNVACWVKKD
jgi:hypothetical protein